MGLLPPFGMHPKSQYCLEGCYAGDDSCLSGHRPFELSLKRLYPCDLSYWVMSIHYPIGLALFQAQDIQPLNLSVLQKELTFQSAPALRHRPGKFWCSILRFKIKWSGPNLLGRMYLYINFGIVLQVCYQNLPKSRRSWPNF